MKLFSFFSKEKPKSKTVYVNTENLISSGVDVLFSKMNSLDKTVAINELQEKIEKLNNSNDVKTGIIKKAFDKLITLYPEHETMITESLKFELDIDSDYISADMIDNVIEEIKNKELTPEKAEALINKANENGEYLGEKFTYYANIAGQPYEQDMMNELNEIDSVDIFDWERKQRDSGRYFTNNVFKRIREIEKEAKDISHKIFEIQQKAMAFEAEGNIDEAIQLYKNVCDQTTTFPYSFERLAIIYRKQKEYQNEIELCEKYVNANKTDYSDKTNKFRKRITRAKQLLEN